MLINSPNISGSLTVTGNTVITGSLTTSIAALGSAATTFLTSDGGTIKSRTAAQTLSDLGAQATGSYVPYTGATTNVDLGDFVLTSGGLNVDSLGSFGGALNLRQATSFSTWSGAPFTSIYATTGNRVVFSFSNDNRTFTLDGSLVSAASPRTFTFPDATGTFALTSQIPTVAGVYLPLTGGAITGSLIVNGNQTITGSFTVTTGSVVELQVTNTGVNIGNITTDNHNVTGSLKVSGSFTVTTTGTELQVTNTGVNLGNIATDVHNVTGSLRVSGSNSFNGSQVVTGSLTVTGQVVAQTLNVQQVTSSIVFSSGSNVFGNSLSNTQKFTGSMSVTGSLTVTTTGTELQVTSTGVNLGNALTDVHTITGSLGINGQGTFYQPLTNSTAYLTVQNNRARNAAVYTQTTNGGFYAGTSIGTDTFNYQIYDGVAGSARLTISSTGAATFASSVTAALGINAIGQQKAFSWQRTTGTASDVYSLNADSVSTYLQNDTTSNILTYWSEGGNVGIGTTSPTALLHLGVANAAVDGTKGIKITNVAGTTVMLECGVSNDSFVGTTSASDFGIRTGNAERMRITSGGITIVGHTTGVGTNFSPPIQVKGGAGIGNGFGIISGNNEMVGGLQLASSGTNSFNIAADPDNLRSSSEIGFTIDGSTRMLINSNGIVDISGPLVVKGTLPVDQTSAAVIDHFSSIMRIFSYGASGTTGTFEFRNAAGGAGSNLVATINASGVYTAVSDINKKKDFEQSTIGLDAILGLKPTLYRMRNDESEGNKELGFIAQEVKEFIPQAYVESGEDDDKFIGLNYNAIVAALVKSVQELKTKIEILEQS